MPLELDAPTLDVRSFDVIKREALLRIPRYTPEWTDFNESDPGVTLIELFAWMTEMLLVQMNRVPDLAYVKFLKLLGLELRPAQPSRAYLVFSAQPDAALVGPVAKGAQFQAQPPEGEPIIFEASEGTGIISLELTDLQVFDGAGFTVVTPANAAPGTTFRPFGWQGLKGSALYLGFTPAKAGAARPPFPKQMSWHIFMPQATPEPRRRRCQDLSEAPVPPAELVWEYRAQGSSSRWQQLQVFADASVALTREGTLKVQGPEDALATSEGRVPEERFWLRVRAAGAFPPGTAPLIDFIRPNVAEVRSLATVTDEVLGESRGIPDQVFTLQSRPVQPGTLALEEELADGTTKPWVQKEDFLASTAEDAHYALNATAGEVRFGDGANGLIPAAGSLLVARTYQYGGGAAANLPPDTITTPLTALPGVAAVSNPRPAVGGSDEERIEDFLACAPARLRHRNRAVSADDYATLAREIGGVGKAIALPQFHPDYPAIKVPGVVTVVVVPDTADPAPRPSLALLEEVCRQLEARRPLTTELYVIEPTYVAITVEARVEVEPYASFDQVCQEVIAAINGELDPLGRGRTAKTEGRAFGLHLYPTSLFSVIQQVPYVKAVTYLAVNNKHGVELNKPIEVPPHALVYGSDRHTITVAPYRQQ